MRRLRSHCNYLWIGSVCGTIARVIGPRRALPIVQVAEATRLEPGRARRAGDAVSRSERPRQPKPSREMVVVPVFESGRKLSTSAERFRGLATAYADAKLGKQKLRLGCVLVSRGGSFVYCFDVSM